MKLHYIPVSLMIVAICASLASANEESKSLRDKIFVENQQTLTPEETKDLLVKLKDSKPEDEQTGYLAVELVNMGIESRMLCFAALFNRRRDLQQQYESDGLLNLVAYLKENKLKHFGICKEQITSKLAEAVDRLAQAYDKDLRAKIESMSDHLGSLEDTRDPKFAEALKSYMNGQKKRNIFTSSSKKAKDFDSLVVETCADFDGKISGYAEPFEVFRYDKDLRNQIDQFSLKWTKKVVMCENILRHQDYLSSATLKG